MNALLKISLASALISCLSGPLSGQAVTGTKDSLRKNKQRCLIFSGFAGLAQPARDLAAEYGSFGQAGGCIEYVSKSGFMAGTEAAYLFGGGVKNDPIPNIRNPDNTITGTNGSDAVFKVFQRGSIGPVLRLGYCFREKKPFFKNNPAGGLTINASLGWLRHFTYIQDISKKTPQFSDQYRIGYDRLASGLLTGLWVGYLFIPEHRGLNLHFEMGYGAGFTKTARYSFADGTPPGTKRNDHLFQARLKICFTVRSRAENTVYYY
jgi:hypothetical protein